MIINRTPNLPYVMNLIIAIVRVYILSNVDDYDFGGDVQAGGSTYTIMMLMMTILVIAFAICDVVVLVRCSFHKGLLPQTSLNKLTEYSKNYELSCMGY